MPIPATIDDLSTTASSNGPAGSETPTDGDGYLRAHAGFIAELRDKTNGTDTLTIRSGTFSGTMAGAATWSGLQTFAGGIANVEPSTYTPTLTSVSNVSGTVANTCLVLRVGACTLVFGSALVTASGAGSCAVGVSLPVSSDIGSGLDVAGVSNSAVIGDAGFGVSGDTTNDRAQVNFYATSSGARSVTFAFFARII